MRSTTAILLILLISASSALSGNIVLVTLVK